jgi:hypothetical protein
MHKDSKFIFENYSMMNQENRVNTGFARSKVLDGFVTVFQNLDNAETIVLLKMLNDNLPRHEFAEFLTNISRHPGFKSLLPKLGDIKKMLGGYQKEMNLPKGI